MPGEPIKGSAKLTGEPIKRVKQARCAALELTGLAWLQGYGTVRFETADATQAAISAFHESDLQGRTLAVRLDRYA